MGKTKPTKKGSSPLKISSSLFQRRSKTSGGGESESSLSSPSPPPAKKIKMKAKSKDSTTKESAKTKTETKSPPKKVVGKKVVESKKGKASSNEADTKKKVVVKVKAGSSGTEKGKGGSSSSSSVKALKGRTGGTTGKTVKKGSGNSSTSGKSKDKTPSKTASASKKKVTISKKTPPRKVVKKRSSQVDSTTTDTSSVTSVSSYSSSSTSRATRTTTSSSRTPSPTQKSSPNKKMTTPTTKTSSAKKSTTVKKVTAPTKTNSKGKTTKSAVVSLKSKLLAKNNKGKATLVKTSKAYLNKAKGKKPVKPKAKLKRMASLNAKAILEATLSFEAENKKKISPAGTPTKASSVKGSNSDLTVSSTSTTSTMNDTIDLKPLTLLFSSPQTTEPISLGSKVNTSAQKQPGERKRKSSTTAAKSKDASNDSGNRRESTASNNSGRKNSTGGESSQEDVKPKKNMSTGTSTEKAPMLSSNITTTIVKSPKKVKVSVSSVSTSTSPFEMSRDESNKTNNGGMYHQQQHGGGQYSEREMQSRSRDSFAFVPYVAPGGGDRSYSQVPFSVQGQNNSGSAQQHGVQHTSHRHSIASSSASAGKQSKGVSSAGCQTQTKERNQSLTPVAHYSSTVYQPAGPLIEPHKMVSTVHPVVQSNLLPDSVRLPADLKVTYQTHPPTTCVLTSSSASTNTKASSFSNSSKHQKSASTSSASSSGSQTTKHGKQTLHQPYKATASSSTSISMTSNVTRQAPEVPNLSFAAPQASFAMPSSSISSPSLLSQHGSSSISGNSSQGTSIYYGYNAPHQSPFAPSKFPIVPPDSYRTQSPYPSSFLYTPTPATPQPTPNYLMTPFYTPPLTPNTASASLGLGGIGQPRALLAAHHPSTASAGAYFHTGPPPSAHPTASSYYVAAPQLQPAHHSIPSASAPGLAGRSHPNPSSHPACHTECFPQNNNSTSSNSNSFINNNKVNNRQQPQRKPPQQQLTIAMPQEVGQGVGTKKKPAAVLTATTKINRRKEHLSPTVAAVPPKTFRLQNNSNSTKIDLIQARQLESAKTFTEQYSLPDDITITPIIMNPNDTKSHAFSQYNNKVERKKKDIVHLIDPRSGQKTTIAKHISNNNIIVNHSSLLESRNVSTVKPNNAGNVGKISPDLDVIVLAGAGKKDFSRNSYSNQPQNLSMKKNQRVGLAISPGNNPINRLNSPYKEKPRGNCATFITNSNTNMVLPLPQAVARSENKNAKRKGLTLSECIDGLQRKKMRILADTNISITNVTPNNNFTTGSLLNQGQITILPSTGSMFQQPAQKSGRKDNNPKQRSYKVNSPGFKKGGVRFNRVGSSDTDLGTTFINCNDAMLAASALVIPQSGIPYTLPSPNAGIKKGNPYGRKPLKLKISTAGGKITTRSSVQNSKVKTRAKSAASQGRPNTPKVSPVQSEGRDRSRLIRLTKPKDNSPIFSLPGETDFPSYFTTLNSKEKAGKSAGNGSSTMTTFNNHVILRIPKSSNNPGKSKNLLKIQPMNYGKWPTSKQQHFPASTSGNMTLAALKKRAIVKPLSPTIINGAISSLPLVNRKPLPTHSHPRFSNGWTFEGKSFEAKVYLRNDDQPVFRRCYSLMRHEGGDVIRPRDCVLLKSGPRKTDLPFVAKVAALWENPTDGEMMFSLLWYYRPEHTEMGRLEEDMFDEIFASKHRDSNSVATIEDKCYVLTFNEYCRYKKRLKQLREGILPVMPVVPLSTSPSLTNVAVTNFATDIATAVMFGLNANATADPTINLNPPVRSIPLNGNKVSPEVVFFCRKVYDYRQKRMVKNPS